MCVARCNSRQECDSRGVLCHLMCVCVCTSAGEGEVNEDFFCDLTVSGWLNIAKVEGCARKVQDQKRKIMYYERLTDTPVAGSCTYVQYHACYTDTQASAVTSECPPLTLLSSNTSFNVREPAGTF
jgi:hypothetical protein